MCYTDVIALSPDKISNLCTGKSPQDPSRNGDATEDVEAAGRVKSDPEREPTYEKRSIQTPGMAASHRNRNKTS